MTTVPTMPLMCPTALDILTLQITPLTTEITETMERWFIMIEIMVVVLFIMGWREKLLNMTTAPPMTLVTMMEDLNMTVDLTIIRIALLF